MNSDGLTLSLFINTIRNLLSGQGYFEHHLYSTTSYEIENTDTFALKDGLYLRYNPEPDIWQVGTTYDKFFWIGSMFRNEKNLDELHQNEFTVVDIYQAYTTMQDVVAKFLEILETLEKSLDLPHLSKKVSYISHKEFNDQTTGQYLEGWYVVTDYPVQESFYDTAGKDEYLTSKFELYYVSSGRKIEIAACGALGSNLNKENYIKERNSILEPELADKQFTGFGIGLERLIQLYKSQF